MKFHGRHVGPSQLCLVNLLILPNMENHTVFPTVSVHRIGYSCSIVVIVHQVWSPPGYDALGTVEFDRYIIHGN